MALSFAQRMRVLLMRAVVALLRWLMVVRPKPSPPSTITSHSYGSHPRETLDVIAPAPDATPRAPVIYIHGGGWIACSKELYTADLYFLAEQHGFFNLSWRDASKELRRQILAFAERHDPNPSRGGA